MMMKVHTVAEVAAAPEKMSAFVARSYILLECYMKMLSFFLLFLLLRLLHFIPGIYRLELMHNCCIPLLLVHCCILAVY